MAIKARALVHGDTSSYPNANVLIDINIWYQKVISMILESMDEQDFDDSNITATYPIATRVLVAARRDYAFSTASWTILGKEGGANSSSQTLLPLKVRRLDVTYDGTNYYKAEPLTEDEIPTGIGNDTLVDANYIKQAPRYAVKFNSVWVYPMAATADVSAGALIRLEQERNVVPFTSSDLTTGTAVAGFDAPFHPIIPMGCAYEFALANNLPQIQAFAAQLVDWEARIRAAYSKKNLDRRMQIQPVYDDAYGR